MHPLLDLSELSENQLVEKLAITSSRLMTVRKSGQSHQLIDQLRRVIMACQDELMARNEPELDKEPVAWDMDSYLERNIHDQKQPEDDLPRWKSAALNELSDDGDSPWG